MRRFLDRVERELAEKAEAPRDQAPEGGKP